MEGKNFFSNAPHTKGTYSIFYHIFDEHFDRTFVLLKNDFGIIEHFEIIITVKNIDRNSYWKFLMIIWLSLLALIHEAEKTRSRVSYT